MGSPMGLERRQSSSSREREREMQARRPPGCFQAVASSTRGGGIRPRGGGVCGGGGVGALRGPEAEQARGRRRRRGERTLGDRNETLGSWLQNDREQPEEASPSAQIGRLRAQLAWTLSLPLPLRPKKVPMAQSGAATQQGGSPFPAPNQPWFVCRRRLLAKSPSAATGCSPNLAVGLHLPCTGASEQNGLSSMPTPWLSAGKNRSATLPAEPTAP